MRPGGSPRSASNTATGPGHHRVVRQRQRPDGRRTGKHVVWSNGTVTRDSGRVRWTSNVPAAERKG